MCSCQVSAETLKTLISIKLFYWFLVRANQVIVGCVLFMQMLKLSWEHSNVKKENNLVE